MSRHNHIDDCAEVRRHLDSLASDELSVDRQKRIEAHLGRCPECFEQYRAILSQRQRLAAAVSELEVPAGLHEKVRATTVGTNARDTFRTEWRPKRRWMARLVTSAALLVLGFYLLNYFVLDIGGHREIARLTEHVDSPVERLLSVGLVDHVHCAVFYSFGDKRVDKEEMYEELGERFDALVPLVQRAIQEYELVVGHRCDYDGREHVHLIVRREEGDFVSLAITERLAGESYEGATPVAHVGPDLPIYATSFESYNVAGFEAPGYLAFVVSELGSEENLAIAQKLAPPVREWFATRL